MKVRRGGKLFLGGIRQNARPAILKMTCRPPHIRLMTKVPPSPHIPVTLNVLQRAPLKSGLVKSPRKSLRLVLATLPHSEGLKKDRVMHAAFDWEGR
ncbi:hypothetical protein [Rhizobium binae]|uniref:hypothetical protein n=1 Tax=Rhizobium binae TaxID=1138190 RepID=UPI001C8351C9|nr:hypothetical protein [Rhizobium binae]MBX4967846.1 hypothetical protein [Rhizobium binae]